MTNRYAELLGRIPKGSFYDAVGVVLPLRSTPYEFFFAPVPAARTFGVYVTGQYRGDVLSDANGRALVRVTLDQGRQDIVLVDGVTQERFTAFVDIRASATVLAAHAAVFEGLDASIDDIQAALALETASSRFIEDVHGRLVRQPNDLGGWLTESYRRLLRRLRQAFRWGGAKRMGVRQVVSAFTSALPLRVPRAWRAIWTLGQQLVVNGDLAAHARLTDSPLTNLNLARANAWVHAAFGGAPTIFPGPFTDPPVAQLLTVTFSAGWTGGSVTVAGFDPVGGGVSDTFVPTGGPLPETVVGVVVFEKVSGATKGAGAAGTASIGIATSRFIRVVEFGGLNPPGAQTLAYLASPDRLRWAVGPTVEIPTSGVYTLRSPDVPAIWFGLAFEPGGGYVVGDEHFLALEFDGRGAVLVDLASALFGGGASPRTAAQVATSINNHFARDTVYGAVRATGTITCVAATSIVAGETVTIADGVQAASVLRYRKSGSDGLGAVLRTDIDLVDDTPTATTVASLTRNTVNGLGGDLRVDASSSGAVVRLENNFGGSQGNVAITDTVAAGGYTHTGMTGGANGGYATVAAAVPSLNSLGTVVRFIGLGGGPSSVFRLHAWGADAASVVLGEPRVSALLQAGAAARAVTLDVLAGARLPDLFEALVLHAAMLDTAGVVSAGFVTPTRVGALEVFFDGAWRGGVLRVFGTDTVGDTIVEDFPPPAATVGSGLRAVSFDGTTVMLGGRGDTLTSLGATTQIDDADGAFVADMVGTEITIANATTGANDGTYTITAVNSATQAEYDNAAGVTEAFAGVYGLDGGELFSGVTAGMFFRRTDNGTGAFVRYGDLATVGDGVRSYRVRLASAIAGSPWGPVAWEVTRDGLTKGTAAFKTVEQVQVQGTPGAGTAGAATLCAIDAATRGVALRVGRNVRDSGVGSGTIILTTIDGSGKTALFADSATTPAFVGETTDGWLLVQGATADGGTNNGLHPIYGLGLPPSPGFGFLFVRHQDADRGGRFANENLPGGCTWRIYNRGEEVVMAGKDTGSGDLILLPPGLGLARVTGDLVEEASGLPFTELGYEGPGTITVEVDRTLIPSGATSDVLTLSGTSVPDGWRAFNNLGASMVAPGYFGRARLQLLGTTTDADGIGAKQALEVTLRREDVEMYRGFVFRASFWVQQHTDAAETVRIDFSFDGTTFAPGTAVAGGPANPRSVAGTHTSGTGLDGVRDPVLCQAEAEVPFDAATGVVRLVQEGTPAVPPPFILLSIEKCVVQAVPVTSIFLGDATVVYGAHRAKFGELLYVWSPEALGDGERLALGVPEPPAAVPVKEGRIDEVVNAHGYWERFDVSEYSSGAAVNVRGAYDEVSWFAATLSNMEVVLGTPPRTSVVRPALVSLTTETLTMVAPSNATLAETSAHEGTFPEESFTDERLDEDGLPVPATPAVAGGVLPWRFLSATTVQVASVAAGDPAAEAVFDATASYVATYRRLTRVEPEAFDLGADFADYLWLVDAVVYRRIEVAATTFARTQELTFLANFQAALAVRSDGDRGTSSLVKDTGVTRSTVAASAWRYVDGATVEVDATVFDPDALYALSYMALEPSDHRPARVVIEARSSAVSLVDVAAQTWRAVEVDTLVDRTHRYHQVRATIAGVVGGRVQQGSGADVVGVDVTLPSGRFAVGVRPGMLFRFLSGGALNQSAHILSVSATHLVLEAAFGLETGVDWEVLNGTGADIEIAGLGLRGLHLYGADAYAPGIIV